MYAEATVVYSDILFLINFSLDYISLFITSRILNRNARWKRLCLGAVIGGAYSFVPYCFRLVPVFSFLLNLIAAGVICFAVFGKREVADFLKISGTFIVSSALFGGLITALYSITGSYFDGIYTEVNLPTFIVALVLSAFIAIGYGLICKKKIHIRSAEIKIYAGDEKIKARLLCDSGNLVTEPFSALPVIVLSASALPYPLDNPESAFFPFPVRIIPFSTSAGKSCFMGFRPDKIEILIPAKKPKTVDAFIGVDTANRNYSGYDGLLPTSLI